MRCIGVLLGAYGLTYEHPTFTKNRDADAGNPNVNVYHSIEDLQDDRKVEHLYDEIKQKEGQGKLPGSGESGLQCMIDTDASLNVTVMCMWGNVCHFHLHLRTYVHRVSSDKH